MSTKKKWFHVLADTVRLDIYDLNYIYSSRIFDRFLQPPGRVLPIKGLLLRVIVFFKHMAEEFDVKKWEEEKNIQKGSYLFFSQTQNQLESLKPVAECVENSCLFGKTGEYSFSRTSFKAYIYSLPFIIPVLFHMAKSKGRQRLAYSYNLDRYWFTYGFYLASRNWLHNVQPQVLVMANDHVIENRIMLKAAQDEKIQTIYLQHASVTDEFPILEFDYAFLEGKDALNTYAKIGPSKTKVFLIGSPKFDQFLNEINHKEKIETLGICSNMLDEIEAVEEFVSKVRKSFPQLTLYLRPHPSDKKIHRWQEIAQKYGLLFSDSKKTASFEFLGKIDCVIAGNSNIHLEATILNIYPIFYDFSGIQHLSSYSFISQGLCEYFSDFELLRKKITLLIAAKGYVRQKAKYYIDTIGTKFDGHSSNLACSLFMDIFQEKRNKCCEWHRLENDNITAYSLEPDIQNE